jgi:YidC/Oxa1 family membrane protein insertase
MSTVFARLALLPLVRTQVISSQKLALAMPEISFLYQLLIKRLKSKRITETQERMRIISVFFHGVDACFRLYDVSYKEMFAYPIVNIGVFMTFIYSVRSMITHSDNYDLLEGGVLWFVDLSSKDPTFLLPLGALSLSYLAMELGFGKNQKGAGMLFKDGLQSLVLLSVPFVTTLPAGVFCYWIPSSLFAIAQSQVIKGPYAQTLLGIPPPKLPPHLQAAQKKEGAAVPPESTTPPPPEK